jgi:CRP-like cAMP-binding protein
MTANRTKLWYLKNLDIFSHLRDEEYRMLDEYSQMREVKKGDILYLQGSSDKNIYILKKGAVKITKLTPQGKEIILDICKGGTIFGEMTYVEPVERDESAEVIEDGLLCIMKKEDFDRMLQMVPGLSIRLTKMIGLRRWKIENKILDLLYSTVEQRLARTLLNLLDDFGVPYEEGYMIKLKLKHSDYADLIASTRETVTATLNKMKKQGIITFKGKYIIVKSMDILRRIADNK